MKLYGELLGTLPIDSIILPDQHLVFGGQYWKVIDINCERKTILVVPAKVGKPPKFGGAGMGIHDRIRQEMYAIYRSGDHRITIGDAKLEFLDATGQRLFQEGLGYFRDTSLEFDCIVQHGSRVYIIPWMGDKLGRVDTILLHDSDLVHSTMRSACNLRKSNVTRYRTCYRRSPGATFDGVTSSLTSFNFRV